MSKTYKFQSEAAGWSAKTYADPEKVANEILSFAVAHPTGFLGGSNDGALHFKGVTIRFNHNMEQLGYKINVEFLGDVKRIKQGFFDMYMHLVDVGLIHTEPSERVELEKLEKIVFELTHAETRILSDQSRVILVNAKIKSEESSKEFLEHRITFIASKYCDDPQYVLAVFAEEVKLRTMVKDEELYSYRVKDFVPKAGTLDTWVNKIIKAK